VRLLYLTLGRKLAGAQSRSGRDDKKEKKMFHFTGNRTPVVQVVISHFLIPKRPVHSLCYPNSY
jgi:hypothetical protein